MGVTLHKIWPPTSIQTWLQQYSRGAFLYSAHCSFGNTISLRSVWCKRATIPGEIFTNFVNFQGIVSVNDFRIPLGFKELLQASLGFLWSFFFARIRLDPLGGQVLHHDCISMIVSRFTTFTENFAICCYQVTEIFSTWYGSANASSARCPCNLVLWQISQFRSLGKWILTLSLPKSSRLLNVSKNTSWEELAWESPCSGISSSTKCSLNSCSYSGISERNGSSRSLWLAWSTTGCPDLSSTLKLDTDTGITFNSILSFSSLTITWCYCRWRKRSWKKCRMMTLLSWKCPWSWHIRTARRTRWQAWSHDRNENPSYIVFESVFNETWFLTVDPLMWVSMFIAKLCERQYCWPLSKLHPILRHWLSERSSDFSMSPRFPIQRPVTHRSPQQVDKLLMTQVDTNSQKMRRMLFYVSASGWRNLANSTLLRGHLALVTLSPPETDPQFWGIGVALMRFTWANQSERRILVSNVCVTCNDFREFYTSDGSGLFRKNRWRFRPLHILKYAVKLSCNFQHCHCTLVFIFLDLLLGCASTWRCAWQYFSPNLHALSDLQNKHSGKCHFSQNELGATPLR